MLPVLLLLTSCSVLQNNAVLREHISNGADSNYIYTLPFAHGKNVFVVQGYHSWFSHKHDLAIDFKVKKGTPIFAARGGVIAAARANSSKRGLHPENLADGNYIFIAHDDGSVAHYWHLQQNGVFVKEGDNVNEGQLIGLSGNTGYSAFPHLHFDVAGYDAQGNFTALPTRFKTQQGILYLKPGRFYRAL